MKMAESQESADEIKRLAESVATAPRSTEDVLLGIVAGRLYNSFRYQSRRILGRDPLPEEFDEFVDRVSGNVENLLGIARD